MRNQKKLMLEQVDQKLKNYQKVKDVVVPDSGWIHTIRKGLNMTLEQLGIKLGITKQGVRKLEQSEANETITLKSLKEIGNSLDLQLVYGFVPKNGSLEKLVEAKSVALAKQIVERTHQNMVLEDQATYQSHIDAAVKELAEEIKREMRRSIWD